MHPSFATRLNLDLLEQNYERWQKDPDSLDSGWSAFFEGFELGNLDGKNGAAVGRGAPPARREVGARPLRQRADFLVYFLCHLRAHTPRGDTVAEKLACKPPLP